MLEFQYYPAKITTNEPLGFVTLDQFINGHKKPSAKTVEVFAAIADAELANDKKLKSELKQNNLYYFTPAVVINGYRRYDNIESFTGLAVLDFDHLDGYEYSEAFKDYLFHGYKSIIACWLSPSRNGVKALVSIPIVETVSEFKSYYFGLADEMDELKGFDPSGQNAVLPLFQSYDPNLLYRTSYETWTTKGAKENSTFDKKAIEPPFIDITDRDKEAVIKIIKSGFQRISEATGGHPSLRALCIAIGGYVATGYVGEFEAMELIEYLIDSHPYLSKGTSGYKKTARWALNEGQRHPTIIEHKY